ncbi:MAG TPA: biotin/lipoyl-containing protein, partial [Dehalococcoidia bacterium]
ARLYAEDPFHGYLPSTGRIERFELPTDDGVRVDGGFSAGATVSPYYDSMLAKIIACGADREQARERLLGVLDAADVQGVQTNLPLLRALIGSPAFAAGAVTTDFLEPFWEGERAARQADGFPHALLLGAAALTLAGLATAPHDPWRSLGPWRVSTVPRSLRFRHGAATASVTAVPATEANTWRLQSDGGEESCRIECVGPNELLAFRGHEVLHVHLLEQSGGELRLQVGGLQYDVAALATPAPDVAAGGREGAASGRLTAPMPGVIVRLAAAEGQRVRMHETLAVLEAMKMEHAIQAPADGVVSKVHVAEGSRVAGGAVLIELEL